VKSTGVGSGMIGHEIGHRCPATRQRTCGVLSAFYRMASTACGRHPVNLITKSNLVGRCTGKSAGFGRQECADTEDQLIFRPRSSLERGEFMLAFVMKLASVSTWVGTCSFLEAASAVLTPS
jgi:hypothetical protein